MSLSRDPFRKDAQLPLRVRLFRLQHGLCWWCDAVMRNEGDPTHKQYATVDHIIGLGRGGHNHRYNKLLAHRVCNEARGSVPADKLGAPPGTTTLRMFQWQQIERLQKIAEQRNETPKAEPVQCANSGSDADSIRRLPAPPRTETPTVEPVQCGDSGSDSDGIYRLPAPPLLKTYRNKT